MTNKTTSKVKLRKTKIFDRDGFLSRGLRFVLAIAIGFGSPLSAISTQVDANLEISPESISGADLRDDLINYPAYKELDYLPDYGTAYEGNAPDIPLKQTENEPVVFEVSTDPSVLAANGLITFFVRVTNNSSETLSSLTYTDHLESGMVFVEAITGDVSYNSGTNIVTLPISEIGVKQTLEFSYKLDITASPESGNPDGQIWLHAVELSGEHLSLKTEAVFWIGQTSKSETVEVDRISTEGGWVEGDIASIYVPPESLDVEAIVKVTLLTNIETGPELQFEVELLSAPSLDVTNGEIDESQKIAVGEIIEEEFDTPAFLEVDFSSVVDLEEIPGGKEPYVATYDPENQIWVKQPILDIDLETNRITVEVNHFSTWGGGLGDSLPQNGANVLLFDQPYTSLFTGGASYSIPIWTPPGRAGMSPSLSLSYSSRSIDGVLGDIQAPWVGLGWNIDGVEIVRQIDTDQNGYGYENNFALTFNGEQHNLLQDPDYPELYYTERASFLYVERHNLALGNAGAVPNATKEWWEIVATDGTRYRLGWNNDSEQRTLMYGYKCTTGSPCTTPNSPYTSLGYAGSGTNVVASRWRVDLIKDTHGNFIRYSYYEEEPSAASQIPLFDRASYLEYIDFTGFTTASWPAVISEVDAPAYQVHFVRAERTGDTEPLDFGIWDQWDSDYLDKIQICYGDCDSGDSTTVRLYDLGYEAREVPNANGTLTLTSISVSGLWNLEEDFTTEAIEAPSLNFDYTDLDNRDVAGDENVWTYPRLLKIENGYGGVLTYEYEELTRGTTSWHNYRISKVVVDTGDELSLAAIRRYTYGSTVYAGQGGNPDLGALIGYPTVTERTRNLADSDPDILQIAHTFGTQGLDVGREYTTEWKNPDNGQVLRKTRNTYLTDNTQAPFSGWNFRYLRQVEQFELIGSTLSLINKVVYQRDPGTGNLISQNTYLGGSLYRKQAFEYRVNSDPPVYILDRLSRQTLRDASNNLKGDVRNVYDGGAALALGELTLTQSLTGSGSQSVDVDFTYDDYGNLTLRRAYLSYGTAGTTPTPTTSPLNFQGTEIEYDDTLNIFPVTTTNALGQSSETSYIFTVGLPEEVTDPNGWSSTTTYDGLGRVLSTTAPSLGSPGVLFTYPEVIDGAVGAPYNLEMEILDTLGPSAPDYRVVTGIYDGLSRILGQQVVGGGGTLTTETSYNDQGLVDSQSLPRFSGTAQYTQNEYDLLGRVVETTQPGDITTQIVYSGLSTTTVDANNHQIMRTSDGLGRMINVKEYSGENPSASVYAVTQYGYDISDRLVQVRDDQNNITTISCDWLGRKISMDDPDMGEWTYEYDALGNLIEQTDAKGQTLGFEYDLLNRLVEKINVDEEETIASYVYGTDPGEIGFRIGMDDESGATIWSYSNYGRTVTETRSIEGVEGEFEFVTESDWLGRVASITYPDSEEVSYSYDDLGRADGMSGDEVSADLQYNPLGQITQIDLGNDVVITNAYDVGATNRLENRTAYLPSNPTEPYIDFIYEYDPVGNITSLSDEVMGEEFSFEYDHLDRLVSAEGVSESEFMAYRQLFDYDSLGNILQVSNFDPGMATIGTYEESYAGLWILGDWDLITDASASGGAYLSSSEGDASVRFQFEGSEFSYIRKTGADQGNIDIYVDGTLLTQVSNSAGSTTFQVASTHAVSAGEHWVEFKVASGTVNLDAIQVLNATPTPTLTPSETPTPTATDTQQGGYLPLPPVAVAVAQSALLRPAGLVNSDNQSPFGFQATDTPTETPIPSETPVPTATHTPTAIPTLLAQWRFEEGSPASSAQDGYGASNDTGTISGATWTTGVLGQALLFDGSNDYVNVASSNDLQPSGSFSIGAWIYPTSVGNGNYRTILMKSGNGWDYLLRLDDEGYIEFQLWDLTPKLVTGPIAPLYTWTNVVGVYDEENDQIRLYVNGELVSAHSFTGEVAYDNAALRIGANGSAAEAWQGRLDEITIYDDALSAVEIADRYDALDTPTPTVTNTPTNTATLTITPTPTATVPYMSSGLYTGLAAYWTLDETTGDRIDSYNNNDLSDINGISWTPGKIGNAAVFAVTGSKYLSIPDNADLSGGDVDFTIAGWFYLADETASHNLVTKWETINSNNEYNLYYYQTTDRFAFRVSDNGNNSGAHVGYVYATNFGGPSAGNWYYIVAWHDATNNQIGIQVNGASNTTSWTTGVYNSTTNFMIGGTGNVRADEVGFWRRILTTQEKTDLYNSGLGRTYDPGVVASTATPTLTPTATPTSSDGEEWGTGDDGNVTITGTVNIDTTSSIANRTCADSPSYSLSALSADQATLSATPAAGCLLPGDEILLINLQSTTSTTTNVGNYEFLRVSSVVGDVVSFDVSKTRYYGDGASDDTNVGTNQLVFIQRIPNYNNLTVNGTLTASVFRSSGGTKTGIIAFRVKGSLLGSGAISAWGLGYGGGGNQGQSYRATGSSPYYNSNLGGGGSSGNPNSGAGGAYGSVGGSGRNYVAYGGSTYGTATLSQLFHGSGGGAGTTGGGTGGGIIHIRAFNINFSGYMYSYGNSGSGSSSLTTRGGGASGGSIYIAGDTITIGTLGAGGGTGAAGGFGTGGVGRIAIYSVNSPSITNSDPSPSIYNPFVTPTTTPTPTATITPTTVSGWIGDQYFYTGDQPHAVTSVERAVVTDEFEYDQNGNMDVRDEAAVGWTQFFNAENRLASVSDGSETWTFVYDGDGNRVMQINPDDTVTLFLGNGFYTIVDAAGTPEISKYYSIARQRIGMAENDGLSYILTDQLGSVSAILNDQATLVSEQRYLPFGSARFSPLGETDLGFNGQRDLTEVGLMDYNARFYDAYLGRFTQSDTLLPSLSNPQSLNMHTYVGNNPIRYSDPTGHRICDGIDGYGNCVNLEPVKSPYTGISCVKFPNAYGCAPEVDIWDRNGQLPSEEIEAALRISEGLPDPPNYAYNDINQHCTVGRGTLLHFGPCTDEELARFYSDEEIEAFFLQGVQQAGSDVRFAFQELDRIWRPDLPQGNLFPIGQAQFDALVSLAYNIGGPNLNVAIQSAADPSSGSINLSILADYLFNEASSGGSLTHRREIEFGIFKYGVYP